MPFFQSALPSLGVMSERMKSMLSISSGVKRPGVVESAHNLRRIVPGSADKSYGIHVARLAGLPKSVTDRAEVILGGLEQCALAPASADSEQREPEAPKDTGMTSLFASPLADELLALDVMAMTPIEAMNELYKLQQKAQKEAGRA